MWTEKSFDGYVSIRGIQGDPDVWINEKDRNTFFTQPDSEIGKIKSHRLALDFR
jgi:hypothetical protein